MSTSNHADHLAGLGSIQELEDQFRTLTGFSFVLGLSSASAGLETMYAAAQLGLGDEVIVPSLTAPETIAPLLHRGCTIVFTDVEPCGLTLSPESAARCVTNRTAAIVVVDIAGQPHDTLGFAEIAAMHGLHCFSDSAQGFGAVRDGRSTGYAADAVVFSMNAQKELAAGEGGILTTHLEWLYRGALTRTQHPHRQARELGHEKINFFPRNGRFNPLGAAVAAKKFTATLDQIEQRRERAPALIAAINRTGLVDDLVIPDGSEPTFPFFIPRWRARPEPLALASKLWRHGIVATVRDLPVRPLHQLAALEQYADQVRILHPLTHTEDAARRAFRLEISWS